MRLRLLASLLLLSVVPSFAQTTKATVDWVGDATRDEMPREAYMDEITLNVGEVINIYADMDGIADSTYESWMSHCWTDHAWVYYNTGKVDNDYILINHTDASIGLSTVKGLKPCKRKMFEIYYSVTWTCPGDNAKYVAQHYYNFYITVIDVKVTSISLPEKSEVREGESITLRPKYSPSEAAPKLRWSSSDDGIATVSQSGTVQGVSEGTADITVQTDNGLSATCSVTVHPSPKGVSFPEGSYEITLGFGLKLRPVFTPVNASSPLEWKSSDPDVVWVYSSGLAAGLKEGTATITCTTMNKLSAECTVKVVKPKEGMDMNAIKTKFSKAEALLKKGVEKLKESGNE